MFIYCIGFIYCIRCLHYIWFIYIHIFCDLYILYVIIREEKEKYYFIHINRGHSAIHNCIKHSGVKRLRGQFSRDWPAQVRDRLLCSYRAIYIALPGRLYKNWKHWIWLIDRPVRYFSLSILHFFHRSLYSIL